MRRVWRRRYQLTWQRPKYPDHICFPSKPFVHDDNGMGFLSVPRRGGNAHSLPVSSDDRLKCFDANASISRQYYTAIIRNPPLWRCCWEPWSKPWNPVGGNLVFSNYIFHPLRPPWMLDPTKAGTSLHHTATPPALGRFFLFFHLELLQGSDYVLAQLQKYYIKWAKGVSWICSPPEAASVTPITLRTKSPLQSNE